MPFLMADDPVRADVNLVSYSVLKNPSFSSSSRTLESTKRRGSAVFALGNPIHAFENRFHALERCARHTEHVACLERVGFFDFFAVLAARPLLNHFDAEFFIFEISFHPLEKTFHEASGPRRPVRQ